MTEHTVARIGLKRESTGISLIELLVSLAVLMIISGTVMDGVLRLTRTNQTVANRSEMHAGVQKRDRTAPAGGRTGRTNHAPDRADARQRRSTQQPDDHRLFRRIQPVHRVVVDVPGEQIVVDTGANEETVTLTAANTVEQSDHRVLLQSATPSARR